MKASSRIEDWLGVVEVSGELDAATAQQLRDELYKCIDGGSRWVLVDMLGLEYIDSVGLGVLIGASKRVSEQGGELAVVCARPNVMRVFEISGTGEHLNLCQAGAEARSLLQELWTAGGGLPQGAINHD